MRCIDFGAACNPALNLAREEYLFSRLADAGDHLLFYINTAAVIIGRNQVPWAEASATDLAKAELPLLRRMSGGGAVYHDPGNLNFSILLQATSTGLPPAAMILQPVVRAIQSLGLPARLSKRNGIFIDRHKVSGTAQYMTAGRILTHGTLLVQADLDRLNCYLMPEPAHRIHSQGRSSEHRPVINLCDLRADITMDILRQALQQTFGATYGSLTVEEPCPGDEQAAASLAAGKYRTWEWNSGRSPQFTIAWEDEFQGRDCRCRLEVRRGLVTRVSIEGAADPDGRLQDLARQRLIGKNFSRSPQSGCDRNIQQGTGSKEGAFHRWIDAHLPPPLPLPKPL